LSPVQVQHAPQTAFPAAPEGFRVQSDIESVQALHAWSFIMHICGGLGSDEGHNIAK